MAGRKRTTPVEFEDRFIIRMPPGMRDRIRLLAAEGQRSLNAQYVMLLQRAIDEIERHNYENSPEGFKAMHGIEDDERSSEPSVSEKQLREMKEQITQALAFLREYVRKKDRERNELETRRLTMQLALWKQEERSGDGPMTQADMTKVDHEIESVSRDLQEANELLGELHLVDPARESTWSIVESGELPAPLVNVNRRLKNHRNLCEKFDWYSARLYMVHRLAEREDDDLYKKAVLPLP